MKIENRNIVLALVFGFVTLSSITTFAGGTFATNNNSASTDDEAIELGDPFFCRALSDCCRKAGGNKHEYN